MKKSLILALAALVVFPAFAQDPEFYFKHDKHLPEYRFELPDSLAHMTPWKAEVMEAVRPKVESPAVTMTSVIVLPQQRKPHRVRVLDNNVLNFKHLTISNGQGWNWGPYPNSFLDARTISVPMLR